MNELSREDVEALLAEPFGEADRIILLREYDAQCRSIKALDLALNAQRTRLEAQERRIEQMQMHLDNVMIHADSHFSTLKAIGEIVGVKVSASESPEGTIALSPFYSALLAAVEARERRTESLQAALKAAWDAFVEIQTCDGEEPDYKPCHCYLTKPRKCTFCVARSALAAIDAALSGEVKGEMAREWGVSWPTSTGINPVVCASEEIADAWVRDSKVGARKIWRTPAGEWRDAEVKRG